MRILQVLPSLDSGGVERGTVEFAGELIARGHESLVMSSGGRLVAQLEQQGSRHVTYPVHRKSPTSLLRVPGLARKLLELAPDVVHVRSRIPAWMALLALKRIPREARPALVSTFHGLYSVNRYSQVMGCGDQVIAISECVAAYIRANYPAIDSGRVTVIHRGADTARFSPDLGAPAPWREHFFANNPSLRQRLVLLMPGRLSPWKGQGRFIDLVAALLERGVDCHGVVVGEPEPRKAAYLQQLQQQVSALGLEDRVSFLGHRSDMEHLYAISSAVFNLSERPEPFGRTVIEALAMGVPVIAWDRGGPAESLRDACPDGLVPFGAADALVQATTRILAAPPAVHLPSAFTLEAQADATLAVYAKALAEVGTGRGASSGRPPPEVRVP